MPPEPDTHAEPAPDNGMDFDAALSFAGEDRDYVQEVNAALRAAEISTFLDSDHVAEMWGEDLIEFLDGVYRLRSRYTLMFISRHYAEKVWAIHERRSAFARALQERSAYVLPVRLDDTELPGLRPTVAYIDARRVGIDGIVRALNAKLSGTTGNPDGPIDRVPRDEREARRVLAERPGGWEYLHLAGVLHADMEALQPKFRDHELRYAAPREERINELDVVGFFTNSLDDAQGLIASLLAVMDPEVQQRALGVPGKPGDAERIGHMAHRWTAGYEGLLDWQARIRGVSKPDAYRHAFELLARVADGPIASYCAFVQDVVAHIDRLPGLLRTGDPVVITLLLSIEVGHDAAAVTEELSRVIQSRLNETS